jgi:hypothetical protein
VVQINEVLLHMHFRNSVIKTNTTLLHQEVNNEACQMKPVQDSSMKMSTGSTNSLLGCWGRHPTDVPVDQSPSQRTSWVTAEISEPTRTWHLCLAKIDGPLNTSLKELSTKKS